MIWNMLHTVFLQSALVFILFGCLTSLLVGISMLLNPQWLQQVSAKADRWFPTSGLTETVNRPRETEHCLKRHRSKVGFAILSGSLLALVSLIWHSGADNSPWLGDLFWILIYACLFAAAIGLAFLLKPVWFESIESWSNRWHDTERVAVLFDVPRNFLDRLASHHARLTGAFIAIASFYALSVIVPLLFKR
ncbi:MAG TPA: hypothetical protein PLK99_06960 [Burkholderiales bacterium]|nr:hypothetical protein [Burkholderiales bacterium]